MAVAFLSVRLLSPPLTIIRITNRIADVREARPFGAGGLRTRGKLSDGKGDLRQSTRRPTIDVKLPRRHRANSLALDDVGQLSAYALPRFFQRGPHATPAGIHEHL